MRVLNRSRKFSVTMPIVCMFSEENRSKISSKVAIGQVLDWKVHMLRLRPYVVPTSRVMLMYERKNPKDVTLPTVWVLVTFFFFFFGGGGLKN